ncbi:OmpA family protein [Chitinophaga horti]|uniref:OmpA family protein n=1 Tax=Chitinophaga horti TaxID=2920382 RepID=A0ABY6J1S1_9BACT|nr:OmpA family protein [Chitinophaga horti]UYQ93618.1 OmpA family protein [Chitinophaga horti]
MKNKPYILTLLLTLIVSASQAQLLKKLKEKVVDKIESGTDKLSKKDQSNDAKSGASPAKGNDSPTESNTIKVFSKFDFIPGKTVIYYDNFEQDNIGETPAGWLTSNLSEVVTIEGNEGKWITLLQKSGAINIIRNKKQSWGDHFTIEFDVFMDPAQTQSADLYVMLTNSGGSMVTDESLIGDLSTKEQIMVQFRIEKDGSTYDFSSARSSGNNGGENTRFIDRERLYQSFKKPAHISIAVTGKRFRFWFNDKKILDVNNGVRPEAIPNLLAFSAHYNTNARFYLSNIRVAKDVPDTRAAFTQGKIISNLLFYTASAEMRPESMGALKEIAAVLKDATEPLKIVGHTDSDGENAANLKLSQQRAETVKQILVKEFGLSNDMLQTEGRGETQPIADNNSAEGKAQNRRVEFIIKAAADTYRGTASSAGRTASPQAKATTSTVSSTGEGAVKLQSKSLNTPSNMPFL